MDDEVATSVPMPAGFFLHPILMKDFSFERYMVLVFKIPRYTSRELLINLLLIVFHQHKGI